MLCVWFFFFFLADIKSLLACPVNGNRGCPCFQVLQVGKELVFCLTAFKELVSCTEGRSALISTLSHSSSSILEEIDSVETFERNGNSSLNVLKWKNNPPLLCCWKKLYESIDSMDDLPPHAVEALEILCLGSLLFCIDGKR